MPNLIKKVQNTCFQHSLLKKGDKIIVAVSGGPDSACLFDIFSHLQKKYSLDLIVAHVNYNLRGADSKKDEELVNKLAEKYGLIIFVKNVKISKNKISENYLRNIRYDFFEKLRKENNFDSIAVAHNADDQVETFLMRLIRGSGTDGLTAIKFRNNCVIRPLLAITRKEIIEYLKINKLEYRTDKTNTQNLFFRNKIRNKLIPILEKDFNLKIKQTIFDSLVSISEDADFLEKETQKYFKKETEFGIKKLENLHPAIIRRVIRRRLECEKGDLKNVSSNQIEEIIKIIKSKKNKNQIAMFPGLKILRRGDKLEITRKI